MVYRTAVNDARTESFGAAYTTVRVADRGGYSRGRAYRPRKERLPRSFDTAA